MSETVTRESDPERFEISVDEGVAGFAEFVDHDGQRIFFHTEIDKAYGGRGLAGHVVAHALAATRTEGLRVVPECEFVAKYVAKHPEFGDLTDPVTPEALAAIPH